MGKAYACDRCGNLFRKENFESSVPVVLESGNPFGINFGNQGTTVSLCPKCREGFQKWWDEEAHYKTTEYQYARTLYEVDEKNEDEGSKG